MYTYGHTCTHMDTHAHIGIKCIEMLLKEKGYWDDAIAHELAEVCSVLHNNDISYTFTIYNLGIHTLRMPPIHTTPLIRTPTITYILLHTGRCLLGGGEAAVSCYGSTHNLPLTHRQ